jgi:hypothetical protein
MDFGLATPTFILPNHPSKLMDGLMDGLMDRQPRMLMC